MRAGSLNASADTTPSLTHPPPFSLRRGPPRPADFIETGTWRGGSSMFAASVFQFYGQLGSRSVWLADSFKGIPPVKPDQYPADAAHKGAEKLSAGESNSVSDVIASFKAAGLYRDPSAVQFLEGYFNETLGSPAAQRSFSARKLSMIRLDGDTYESTIQVAPVLSLGSLSFILELYFAASTFNTLLCCVFNPRLPTPPCYAQFDPLALTAHHSFDPTPSHCGT